MTASEHSNRRRISGRLVGIVTLVLGTLGTGIGLGLSNNGCWNCGRNLIHPEEYYPPGLFGSEQAGAPACEVYEGSAEHRLEQEPYGIALQVTSREYFKEKGKSRFYQSIIGAVSTQGERCGVHFGLPLLDGRVVDLPVGQNVSVYSTTEIRDPEADVASYFVARGGDGGIIYGFADFVRPSIWKPERFDGLTFSVGSSYCTLIDGQKLGTATFGGVGPPCELKDGEEKVCELWGRPYSVRAYRVYTHDPGYVSPAVIFVVADLRYLKAGESVQVELFD